MLTYLNANINVGWLNKPAMRLTFRVFTTRLFVRGRPWAILIPVYRFSLDVPILIGRPYPYLLILNTR